MRSSILNKLLIAIIFIAAALFSARDQQAPQQAEGVRLIKVIDGDTLRIDYQGREELLRLIGIDAPEAHPNQKVQMQSNKLHLSPKELLAQGIRARKFVEKLTDHSREIYLEFDNARYDKYQRLLAYAYLRDGRMINEEVLKAGFAMVLEIRPNTRYHEKFAYALSDAKKKRLGLWQN